jgi:hypothetical protein
VLTKISEINHDRKKPKSEEFLGDGGIEEMVGRLGNIIRAMYGKG